MSKVNIAIINGANMNMLGIRETSIYGNTCWSDIQKGLEETGRKLNINLLFYQSNHEGNLVDFIQYNMEALSGIVINPAAFAKGGYSILDALTAINIPYVEVHMSNIAARGGWHAESIFTNEAIGMIYGFGEQVYELGLLAVYRNIVNKNAVEK